MRPRPERYAEKALRHRPAHRATMFHMRPASHNFRVFSVTSLISTPAIRVYAYAHIKFRVWPGRSVPIEGTYKQEIILALRTLHSEYAEWMVSINNDVGEKPIAIQPYRLQRALRQASKPKTNDISY